MIEIPAGRAMAFTAAEPHRLAIVGDGVYVLTPDGTVLWHVLQDRALTAAVAWEHRAGVYVGTQDGSLLYLDEATGAVLQQWDIAEEPVYADPSTSGPVAITASGVVWRCTREQPAERILETGYTVGEPIGYGGWWCLDRGDPVMVDVDWAWDKPATVQASSPGPLRARQCGVRDLFGFVWMREGSALLERSNAAGTVHERWQLPNVEILGISTAYKRQRWFLLGSDRIYLLNLEEADSTVVAERPPGSSSILRTLAVPSPRVVVQSGVGANGVGDGHFLAVTGPEGGVLIRFQPWLAPGRRELSELAAFAEVVDAAVASAFDDDAIDEHMVEVGWNYCWDEELHRDDPPPVRTWCITRMIENVAPRGIDVVACNHLEHLKQGPEAYRRLGFPEAASICEEALRFQELEDNEIDVPMKKWDALTARFEQETEGRTSGRRTELLRQHASLFRALEA